MARMSPTTPPLCRASARLCRVPITAQALDFSGFVMGVTGVTGFPAHTRARMQAPAHMPAGAHQRGRVHPITPVTPITK